MIWKKPHISKIYEALTALADSRIEFITPRKARCYSSSGNKYYEVEYDRNLDSIMSNDNTAYFTGSVSYPMIAVLMLEGKVVYPKKLEKPLGGIYWKTINQKFNNNYDKSIEYVLNELRDKGVDVDFVKKEIEKIFQKVCVLKLNSLGKRRLPPKEY